MIAFKKETDFGWLPKKGAFTLISGPCSAETEDQVMEAARLLALGGNTDIFRAGVWKPRTRPGAFEGVGEIAFPWLNKVQKEYKLPVAVEVANAQHVELALKYNIDYLWIGARTTVNPFSVHEIAEALRGCKIPVLVKNPMNPDLNLWIGALERINAVGISQIAAIHRGFSSVSETFRNTPNWDIPISLKTIAPELPLLCDPSHIAGNTKNIEYISQKALDLNFNGLMIEVHPTPKVAWSDAKQQLNPKELEILISTLIVRSKSSLAPEFTNRLEQLRSKIDEADSELIAAFAKRFKLVEEIGLYKKEHGVTIFQIERWKEILESRNNQGENLNIHSDFIQKLLELIHQESIRIQTTVLNPNK